MTFKVKTKGQIEGEKLLVPKLRFKEFKNEWNEITLKKLLSFKNGINGDKDSYGYGIKYISVGDILNNTYITYDKIKGLIDINDKTLKENSVEYGDMVFQRSSETFNDIGQANVYLDKKKIATFGGFVIRGKKIGNYNPLFFNYLLKSPCNRKKVIVKGAGAQHYNISQEELEKIKVNFTGEKEQVKIANLFYSLDKKIELQKQKIEALKIYKKGLLYKTFIKCCANCKIKDLLILGKSGGTPKSTNADYYDGNIPFLSITDMTSQGKYIKQTEKHISNLGLENSSAWLLPVNTLILSMYASYGLVSINKISLSTSQAMFNMIFKENINVEYIYYYLNYLKETHFYEELVSTGTQSNLNTDKVKNIPIYLPNKTEQTRISSLFNVLDNKIELQESNLNSLIMLKKSLLQQMFI